MTLNLFSCLTLSKLSALLKRILSFPTTSSLSKPFLQVAKTILNSNVILSFTSVQLPVDCKFNMHATLLSRSLIKMKAKWPRATSPTPCNTVFRSDAGCKTEGNHSQSRAAYSLAQPPSKYSSVSETRLSLFCKPPSVFTQQPLQILSYNQVQQRCQIHHTWISFGVGLQILWGMQSQSLPHLKEVLTSNSFYSWFSGGITLASVDKARRFLSAGFFIRQCYRTAVQLLIFLSPTNKSLN